MNFGFAHPWWLLALGVLPLLAWLQSRPGARPAFVYSSLGILRGLTHPTRARYGSLFSRLRWLILALFIVALARPQTSESESQVKASGVDIVIAVDLSSSMEAEDFKLGRDRVNRLVIAKDTTRKFIARRPNDRIGLVAFSGRAYIAAPLTLDHDFLLQNLDRLELRTIEDGTAIGSALSAAVNRLRDLKSKSKIVVLMTDGQNNAGKVPPLTAAEAAEALGVKVYTIGVGTHGTAPVPRNDVFGRRVYVQQPVDIDEDTLKEIARKTKGRYFRADSADTLRAIYNEIDQLEKTEVEVKKFLRVTEWFPWLVLPTLGLLLLELVLGNTVFRKLP